MALDISRRSLFLGGLLTLAAPAVVRASVLMPIRDPRLVRGFWSKHIPSHASWDGKSWVTRPDFSRRGFHPIDGNLQSLLHDEVLLHESSDAVAELRQQDAFVLKEIERARTNKTEKLAIEERVRARRRAKLADTGFRHRVNQAYGENSRMLQHLERYYV